MRLPSGGNNNLHNRNLTRWKVIIPRTTAAWGAATLEKQRGIATKHNEYTEYVLSDTTHLTVS